MNKEGRGVCHGVAGPAWLAHSESWKTYEKYLAINTGERKKMCIAKAST